MRRKFVAVVSMCVLGMWATQAWAMGANVVFKPSSGNPSDMLTIEGSMFHPNEKVVINWRFSSTRLAEVQADGQGNFKVSVQIPADAHTGPNMVIIAGDQGSGVAQEFSVGGPGQEPDAQADTPAKDGLQPWIFGGGGLVLGLVLGLVVFRRKTP